MTRNRLTLEQMASLTEWMQERENDGTLSQYESLDDIAEAAGKTLGHAVARSNVRTAAERARVTLTLRRGRPPGAVRKAESVGEAIAAIGTEVSRIMRVLDLQPIDAERLSRIAAGRVD